MWRNLQGSIQQIRVHNYGMKLKETASTEYRRIRSPLGSYTGIHNGKQLQQQLQLQLQGQAGGGGGGEAGSFEIQQLGENPYYAGEE